MKSTHGSIYDKVKDIAESKKIDIVNEGIESMYTMDDWIRDGSIKLEKGQPVDDAVVNQLKNDVPPATLSRGVFQVGEPYSHDWDTGQPLYMTFERGAEGAWVYKGLEPVRRGVMWESKTNKNMKKNIVKLNEKQLRDAVKKTIKQSILNENKLWDFFCRIFKRNETNAYGQPDKRGENYDARVLTLAYQIYLEVLNIKRNGASDEEVRQELTNIMDLTYPGSPSQRNMVENTILTALNATSELNESKTNKNMKKNVIKLNENAIRQIVAESVKKVLKESGVYGYDNVDDLMENLLELFNYNSATDTFEGLSPEQSQLLNAVYGYLATGGFNSNGAYTNIETGENY